MSNPTFNGFPGSPHVPPPERGQKEATRITPPELARAAYPGAPRTSDRETVENSGANVESYPGSSMRGEPWKRPAPPAVRGVRR
jgi:hypothetical protein